jgi:hypothetical protein
MHILFENIIKQLLGMWDGSPVTRRGRSKQEPWVVSVADWDSISDDIVHSGKWIPTSIARNINVPLDNRSSWTAQTWSFFLMYLGPILLQGRLPNPYYRHFVQLSAIARSLTRVVIPRTDVAALHRQLGEWVRSFEKFVSIRRSSFTRGCDSDTDSHIYIVRP